MVSNDEKYEVLHNILHKNVAFLSNSEITFQNLFLFILLLKNDW